MIDKRRILKRLESLKEERSEWDSHWKECARFASPNASRFNRYERTKNRTKDSYQDIIDNTAVRAVKIFAAGMMNIASPSSRPWIKLTTRDPDLAKYQDAKVWLFEAEAILHRVLSSSSIYDTYSHIYKQLCIFGTAASYIMSDYDRVIHGYDIQIGEFCISSDYRGKIDTIFRECDKTVLELVKEFGYQNCSDYVQTSYDQGYYDRTVTICHAIEPRYSRDASKKDALNMPYRSVYFETDTRSDGVLRESGFKEFRAICPRWELDAGNTYGISPVMGALGDIRQLQVEQKNKTLALEYMVNPAYVFPTSMQNQRIFPGAKIFHDGLQQVHPLHVPNIQFNAVLQDIEDIRNRIMQALYTPFFTQLSMMQDKSMTAYEVAQRNAETLAILAPIAQTLHSEALEPSASIAFGDCLEAGLFPPIPESLSGQELQIEFVSVLAQAQSASKLNNIDRFAVTLGQLIPVAQATSGKIDIDRSIDMIADAAGVDPSLIMADEKVAMIRQRQAQQQAQMEQMAAAESMAKTAQTLGNTPVQGDNALSSISNLFAGY